MEHKNIDFVRRIDFDRLDMVVSERIGALKLYAQNIDKATEGPEIHDAICRDLILPWPSDAVYRIREAGRG
ncbi:MAG TPA: hypothetical protein PLD21_06280 [Rhodocyclaceae bacterium]|nr:hypothetical protein [Rhodocyclaceae bacterium]